ncbi:branched-chain amino acid ABC transporter permease [Sphaerobacter sp.]|uniref:branched-chain amino acid ABC transporter permease n=1 Tax=Sphaerobacter sp. TaxID=2099654 RepID=UPI001DA5B72C|nr:branched-chain amino acid ABC transporter permease [Sphaerobacter sp.]MBX5444123.1 branched-chain amino acid ABC transporter permease [Sphaerobacter sp.]
MTTATARPIRAIPRSWIALGVLALALLALPLVLRSDSRLNIAILVLVYAALAQAWNILGGFAGQISLGNAAFFGIGAYTSTVLLSRWEVTPWLGMLAGALVAAIFAVIIGYPVFRLGGHYFAIATIALAEIVYTIFNDWEWVGGATGMLIPFARDIETGRPTNSLYYLQFNLGKAPYFYIALALVVLVTVVTVIVDRSKLGYYLRAIKNDQDAARALGVHVLRYKLIAIAISAAFSAVIGTFYAQYLLYIDPETTMRLELSVLIALVAILGGVGTVAGPLVGAAVLIPAAELTRQQLGGSGNAIDLILYGALIVLISIFQPNGLMGLVQRLRHRGGPRPTATPTEQQATAREEAPMLGGYEEERG